MIKSSANNSVIFKPKISIREMNGIKSFENFEFWVGPISKFALVRIIVHQLKNFNLKICMVFTQEFEFCFQIFIPLVLRNLIFGTPLFDFEKLTEITFLP